MRFETSDGSMVIEFTTSAGYTADFGFSRLIFDGNEVGDFADLNSVTFFLAQLRDPATVQLQLDGLDVHRLRADRLLRVIFSDEDLDDSTRFDLGESFDGFFVRRFAVGSDQVFLYTGMGSSSIHVAVIDSDQYSEVTELAWRAHQDHVIAAETTSSVQCGPTGVDDGGSVGAS